MSRTKLFDYEWTCNTPVGSAGTWSNHWRGYLEDGSVSFDFFVILGAEEYLSQWGEREMRFSRDEFTRCLVAALNGDKAEFGTGWQNFQVRLVDKQLELTLPIKRYRDASIAYDTFFLPYTRPVPQ